MISFLNKYKAFLIGFLIVWLLSWILEYKNIILIDKTEHLTNFLGFAFYWLLISIIILKINYLKENIKTIKNNNFPIILIQSKPKDTNKIINSNLVDYYKMFPDITGTGNLFTGDAAKTISHPLGRNLSHAFKTVKSFDADWWIVILGDVNKSTA